MPETITLNSSILAAFCSMCAAIWSTYLAFFLKKKEARLKVAGDMRLRLFERMSTSAEHAARVMARFHDLLKDYPEVTPSDESIRNAYRSLEDSGHFLPPSLEAPFRSACEALDAYAYMDPRNFRNSDSAHEASGKARNYCSEYVRWKNDEFNQLLKQSS